MNVNFSHDSMPDTGCPARPDTKFYIRQEQEQETGMLSRLYISITTYIKYNQKVAAEGDDQLAEPTLPILFKFVMFEY